MKAFTDLANTLALPLNKSTSPSRTTHRKPIINNPSTSPTTSTASTDCDYTSAKEYQSETSPLPALDLPLLESGQVFGYSTSAVKDINTVNPHSDEDDKMHRSTRSMTNPNVDPNPLNRDSGHATNGGRSNTHNRSRSNIHNRNRSNTNRSRALSSAAQYQYGSVIPYTMYPNIQFPEAQGYPLRFHIGPGDMPHKYDVHHLVLAADSPPFNSLLTNNIVTPIALSTMSPNDFGILTKWLYEHVPPTYTTTADLGKLVQLWVSAVALGLWRKANTLMRLSMVLMQPENFMCDISIVRWVFGHTPASSPLRGFIIAIFAQRSKTDASFFHITGPHDNEIFKMTSAFMRKLEGARRKLFSAWGKDDKGLPVFFYPVAEKLQFFRKEGEDPLPMPEYLVWDEQANDLPDMFFLAPNTGAFEDGLAPPLKTNS